MSEATAQPGGNAQLRLVAFPRDANAYGDVFGGWTLSQMDIAGGTFAAGHTGKRVVTVAINAVEFLEPVSVGDDVSLYCRMEQEGDTSIGVHVEVWATARLKGKAHKVTEGVFTYVAVDDDGRPVGKG